MIVNELEDLELEAAFMGEFAKTLLSYVATLPEGDPMSTWKNLYKYGMYLKVN